MDLRIIRRRPFLRVLIRHRRNLHHILRIETRDDCRQRLMTQHKPLMPIPDLGIIPKNPHDFIPEIDALARRPVHARRLDQLRHRTQRVLRMVDHAIHPRPLAAAQQSHLEASQAPRFLDVVIDQPRGGKEVGRLLFDGFELVGYLEDLDRCVQACAYAAAQGGKSVHD